MDRLALARNRAAPDVDRLALARSGSVHAQRGSVHARPGPDRGNRDLWGAIRRSRAALQLLRAGRSRRELLRRAARAGRAVRGGPRRQPGQDRALLHHLAPRQTGKTWIMRRAIQEIRARYGERFKVGALFMQGLLMDADTDEAFFHAVPTMF